MADQRDDYQQDEEDDKKWDENFHASQSASDAGFAERHCKDFMNKPRRNYTPVPAKGHRKSGSSGKGRRESGDPAPCYHHGLNLKRDFEDESL